MARWASGDQRGGDPPTAARPAAPPVGSMHHATTKRDLIRTLVRRIEVNDQHVRVVFRVDPGPTGPPDATQISHLCPSRGGVTGAPWPGTDRSVPVGAMAGDPVLRCS